MHNAWLVIRREYLERIRSKAFIIMTLLMPVFMASTILVPTFLSDMKSGVTRRIVLVASNAAIAEAVKQELMAPPKPRFRLFSMMRTDGPTAQRRAKPWPLLSTTTTSKSRRVWRSKPSRHSRKLSSAARVGMTTETEAARKY